VLDRQEKGWRNNIYTRPARGSAAGGGYATAEDLLRFARALFDCKLLSETWTNWIFTGVEPPAKDDKVQNLERLERQEKQYQAMSPDRNKCYPHSLDSGPEQEAFSDSKNDEGLITEKTGKEKPAAKSSPVQAGQSTIDRSHWGIGIAGGAPGINAMLEMDDQTGYTVIVLANYDPPAARDIAQMIRRYLKVIKK